MGWLEGHNPKNWLSAHEGAYKRSNGRICIGWTSWFDEFCICTDFAHGFVAGFMHLKHFSIEVDCMA